MPISRNPQPRGWTSADAATPPPKGSHIDLIQQSHERCTALGLTRIERPDYSPLLRSDLNVAKERNQRLFTHAAPVMEMLFEQIVDTESMIVLTDAQGTILHAVGDNDFLDRAGKVALSAGVNWAEQSKGTNAIGTALFEERPTLVHADEHFMHANHFLTCSAAPIFDPRGNMLGVLDVSGDQRSYHQHTMGLVRMSARMIENQWLSDDYSNRLRLHFHSRAEFIGTLLEGIIVVGADGKILGANRSALDQLAMTGISLRGHTLTTLFGTTVAAVHDHSRMPLPVPMKLSLPNGLQFHASARFDWGSRRVFGALPEGFDDKARRDEPRSDAAPGDAAAAAASTRAPQPPSGLQFLQTGDAQIEAVVQKVRRVINRDIPLLILGETGTGKELLARAVHQESNRAKQPFVAVNCASIPESLIEAELFGYEEGAFTGARRQGSPGLLRQAQGGVLFLDEIGDMPLALQPRLLRVLQERELSPLGGGKPVKLDFALVCATHCDLDAAVESGRFRADLYYRIADHRVRLSPLRAAADRGLVVDTLWSRMGHRRTLSHDAHAALAAYVWPGNWRQLVACLRTLVALSDDGSRVELRDLPDYLQSSDRDAPAATAGGGIAPLGLLEETAMRDALAACDGNVARAARLLGVNRSTLYRRLGVPKRAH